MISAALDFPPVHCEGRRWGSDTETRTLSLGGVNVPAGLWCGVWAPGTHERLRQPQ